VRDHAGIEPTPSDVRLDREVGRARLAQLDASLSVLVGDGLEHERRRDATSQRARHAAAHARSPPCEHHVDHGHERDRHRSRERDPYRDDQRAEPDDQQRERGTRRRAHRGTGTVEIAVATASSGV
jgi:hypothetical protein